MERFDKAIYGMILGLILPFPGYAIGKYVIYSYGTWGKYWQYFLRDSDYQNQIFTFCMLPTLFLFYFVFFQWKLENFSKGLVGVSLFFVAIFMAIKFL